MFPDHILSLSDVSRSFDGRNFVLSDISFSVAAGECVSIVGQSGCGKSTLLRMIVGLDEPTSGTVSCNAHSTQMLFQEPALLPWRTLRDNVELHRTLHRSNTSDVDILNVLDAVGLAEHQDKYPHQLSGGMKMRASLARALVTDSDLFLFDEPLSAVDEITRESLQDLLITLHRERGLTSLFVTHNIAEAVYLSDRVLVLSRTSDNATQLSHQILVDLASAKNPSTRFTADFSELCQQVHTALHLGTA